MLAAQDRDCLRNRRYFKCVWLPAAADSYGQRPDIFGRGRARVPIPEQRRGRFYSLRFREQGAAGTGSEVSDDDVVIDEKRNTKFVVISDNLRPAVALTDPSTGDQPEKAG